MEQVWKWETGKLWCNNKNNKLPQRGGRMVCTNQPFIEPHGRLIHHVLFPRPCLGKCATASLTEAGGFKHTSVVHNVCGVFLECVCQQLCESVWPRLCVRAEIAQTCYMSLSCWVRRRIHAVDETPDSKWTLKHNPCAERSCKCSKVHHDCSLCPHWHYIMATDQTIYATGNEEESNDQYHKDLFLLVINFSFSLSLFPATSYLWVPWSCTIDWVLGNLFIIYIYSFLYRIPFLLKHFSNFTRHIRRGPVVVRNDIFSLQPQLVLAGWG